jgi:hypothetical protein
MKKYAVTSFDSVTWTLNGGGNAGYSVSATFNTKKQAERFAATMTKNAGTFNVYAVVRSNTLDAKFDTSNVLGLDA